MKKIISCLIIFFMIFSFMISAQAKEKTLAELRAEAQANRDAYNKAKSQKELTEAERSQAVSNKAKVQSEISSIQNEIKEIEKQIEDIQKDIEKKDKQMKEIMGFVQVSNGEQNYLEYIFGATDFTDFIYRVSVAEQLGDYNEKLIEEYNSDVKRLDGKKSELSAKEQDLYKKEQELTVLEAKLSKEVETLKEGMLTKDREYKTTIDLVNSMVANGCRESDTMQQCLDRKRRSIASSSSVKLPAAQVPSTNGTYMPIARGRVTSDYGSRSDGMHRGIDFSNGNYKDNVYSVAAGEVILVQSPGTYTSGGRNCGNWIVYIQHNINGHSYITSYWHLAQANVQRGQTVTPNTVIGLMGGLPSVDACSGGIHVHLNLFDGNSWNGASPNSGRINPRTIMPQIPAKGVYFTR